LVVLTVTLTNRGAEELAQLFYAREWLVPGAPAWTFPPDIDDGRALPAGLARRLWMLDDLAPGASTGATFSFRVGPPREARGLVEVPLVMYTDASWPGGLLFGMTNGVSFGDYDADGWIDVFSLMSARLLRNVGGTTWQLAANLTSVLPPTSNRYGSSFGDYDNDGLPDIGTEPRTNAGDSCMHLLHNLGNAVFEDIATDPLLFEGQPCNAPSETICWGDVDDDGDLDVFLPVYGRNLGPGNFFMENLGPTGPGGAYRFRETSAEAGLDNPPMTARPEGAQFLDVDGDGDMDCYSNGTLYQNRSEGRPLFEAMTETGNGIGLRNDLDEGAAFFDYDLDGDQDLFIVYTQRGVRIWEARGDGTFFARQGIIDEARTGLDLGLSAEDWDMDGDVDFTTRQVFRRNRLVEDGARHFTVATHAIPAGQITSATPAWGDWDRDGDLDCALGNWQATGRLYQNVLWDHALPAEQKPYLRVRVVRDAAGIPRGLETEYGAHVEVFLHGDPHRREKFVASGHGYLNQNEYALTFALPPGPNPAVPVEDLVCDVVVDFPGRASRGVLRVDRHVNPALGGLAIAELAEREITVFRSGRVLVDGSEHLPLELPPRLLATGGGLTLPDPELGLAEPLPGTGPANWVGIEVAVGPRRRVFVKELVLDGVLVEATLAEPFNVALWDVTDPAHPQRVAERALSTSEGNRRSAYPFAVELAPGHRYRCVAHLKEKRALPPPGQLQRAGLGLTGGLDLTDPSPTSGKAVVEAELQPAAGLALRYVSERPVSRR
ncbi:MAG TPA: VCBS repeat-containing protein, partial [Planctomycetota bacterium]